MRTLTGARKVVVTALLLTLAGAASLEAAPKPRNVLIVQTAHAIVAVGGGAGTLSEIALAWQSDKPIVALDVEGFSREFAGRVLDARPRPPVLAARTAEDAIRSVEAAVSAAVS